MSTLTWDVVTFTQSMRFVHHDLSFEVSDEWWAEAGMPSFVPSSQSYLVDVQKFPNCCYVRIDDVVPVKRQLSHVIFNDDQDTGLTARQRVINILRGFVNSSMLPPVEIVKLSAPSSHPYKLTHGAHRFYLSLAAGFTHVPAIEGFSFDIGQ